MAALLLAVVAILFFAPDDLQGRVLQQHDTIQGIANGQEGKAFYEATGESTRWTDALFGGMPNFQISPSYAANAMLGWLNGAMGLWLPAPANLLFAMMLGFFLMCLCFRFRWPVALFAALAWGFSTYFIIIIGAGHIWKFITLAYIPPTIGGIYLCYRGKYLGGSAMAALFAALQLQGNHPQMTYYFLFPIAAMVLAWLWMAVKEGEVRRWCIATLCCVGAGALALGANSASLYNTYEYAKETVRGKSTDLKVNGTEAAQGMSNDAITAWSYGPDETLTLLIPNIKGGASVKPTGGEMRALTVLDHEAGASLTYDEQSYKLGSQFTQYFGNQPMTNGPVYVGAFVLVLAVLALFIVDDPKRTPLKWALLAAMLITIVLSWGYHAEAVTNFMIAHFPGYNKFRAVSSILVVAEFCIPLLAAMAIVKILDTPDFLQRYGTRFYAVAGSAAFICLVGAVAPAAFGEPFNSSELRFISENAVLTQSPLAEILATIRSTRLALVREDSIRSLMYILIGACIVFIYAKGILKSKPAMVGMLTALILIDLFNVNRRYVNSENFVEPLMATSTLEPTPADREILKDTSHYRVMDADGFGSARSSYFHNTIGGYHAAKLTRYEDLIKHQIQKNNMAVLNMLNAKYFIIDGQAMPNPDACGNAWFVDRIDYVADANAEMKGLDSIQPRTMAVSDQAFRATLGQATPSAPGDTIYQASYAPNQLHYRYRSAKGGVAVFSEIYFPWGWKATVNGKETPIGRVDYVLRAMRLPAGEGEVVMTFDPQSTKVTNRIGVASVSLIFLLCAAAIGIPLLRRRRPNEKSKA